MPTLNMFYGIIIRMYYDRHNTPRFYAIYNENEAIINFDGEILKGELPKKELQLVNAWCIIHKKELEANWLLSREII